jgi:hypothetical protein
MQHLPKILAPRRSQRTRRPEKALNVEKNFFLRALRVLRVDIHSSLVAALPRWVAVVNIPTQ